jgi:Arc/MetJ family transcription regulator
MKTSRLGPAATEWHSLVSVGEVLGARRICLTCMPNLCIIVHMRTTLNIDTKLLEQAGKLTGVSEKTALVRMGLQALISKESAKRLAALGGTERALSPIPRRRTR